jgi:hypothetical protein
MHHKLIGIFLLFVSAISNIKNSDILILEHACLSYASQFKPTRNEALDGAYSQYYASNIHINLSNEFSGLPKEYSILHFTEFILSHHLW